MGLPVKDINSLVVFHAVLEVSHIALGHFCLAVTQVEGRLIDELTGIECSGEGTKPHDRPLHVFPEASVWAIPWWGCQRAIFTVSNFDF